MVIDCQFERRTASRTGPIDRADAERYGKSKNANETRAQVKEEEEEASKRKVLESAFRSLRRLPTGLDTVSTYSLASPPWESAT